MVASRAEKVYEKHAWTIPFALGIFSLAGSIPFLLGVDLDPTDEERIIGMTLSELKASNPRFFDFYVIFYDRIVGLLFLSIAIFSIAISATAYRRGEKWAWYTLLYLPVLYIGVVAIVPAGGSALAFLLGVTIVYLLGLLLPYRKFFPRKP